MRKPATFQSIRMYNMNSSYVKMESKEKLFYDALKNIFVGEKIEGQGGYVNLMRIKPK